MTTGELVELKDEAGNRRWQIDEGESMNIEGTLVDEDGTAITEANVVTLTLTLYNRSTKAAINSRDDQDVKDANGGVLNVDGSFIIRLEPADSPIVGTIDENQTEEHVARLKWTWSDGVATRTAIHERVFDVRKLYAVS